MIVQLNEMVPPFKGVHELLGDAKEKEIRTTGVYDAIVADGLITTSNHRYSRKDFINAQKFFFNTNPVLEKSKDRLPVTVVDEFREDGTIRLDRIVGEVTSLQVIDGADTWQTIIRFGVLDVTARLNPWFETMMPLLTKLHGYYKAIPCGKGDVEEIEGVKVVTNFQLRYILLTCNSGFKKADALKPVFQTGPSGYRVETDNFDRPEQPRVPHPLSRRQQSTDLFSRRRS